MKIKTLLISLIFVILAASLLKAVNIPAKASYIDSPVTEDLIRVGISTNDFSQLEYNQVSLTSKGSLELVDKSNNSLIAKSQSEEIFTIKINDGKFDIYNSKNCIVQDVSGPIGAITKDNSSIGIAGVTRKGKPAYYQGEIEIVKAKNNKLSVVNVLSIEDYLRGVVPNELPPSFGLEALKAQAVAARNYAIRPRVKPYAQFDICDSEQCQVYLGYNTRHFASDRAIEETRGLTALYHGEVILAMYSSTAGGYTENYENTFSNGKNESSFPYLKGKPDIEATPVLNNEEAAKKFYTLHPDSFDMNSSYYRWTKTWTKEELEAVLNKNLSKYSASKLISPKFQEKSSIGSLSKIEVLQRGVSGKAMAVKITSSNGSWEIKDQLMIRRIFENSGRILPGANVIFNLINDSQGNLAKIEATGGGLGHGVGMSQFGAGYLSKNGYSFDKILQHYYDGIAIGTMPLILTSGTTLLPIRQGFYSQNGKAELVLSNIERFNNFKIKINSQEINIPLSDKMDLLAIIFNSSKETRINLDKYIKKGLNEIIYYPPQDEEDGKSVKVWVEVFMQVKN